MRYCALLVLFIVFSLVSIIQVFAETLQPGETISTKTNGVTFKPGDTLQITIDDYNNGVQKNINQIKNIYPGILGPCGIAYFDFVFIRGDHTDLSTFDDLTAVRNDAINVLYHIPYDAYSCPLGYFKSIKTATLESNSHNATIVYVDGDGNRAIEVKHPLLAVHQIEIPYGDQSFSFGKYTIVAFSMSGKTGKPLLIEVIKSAGVSLDKTIYPIIASPLKQLSSGVPVDQIQCKEGYELTIKSGDSSPACVRPETKAKLFERKWTTMAVIGGEISRLCYRDPNPGVCKAAIEKYYFDGNTNSCKPFTWGGCGGSVPFDTMNLCQMLCE